MAKGRKSCPSCNTEMGCRTLKCKSCGHDFSSVAVNRPVKAKAKVEQESSPVINSYTKVYAPAGKCPVELKGSEPTIVRSWVVDVQSIAESKRKILTKSAMHIYVSQFYGRETAEFASVVDCFENVPD